jgi:hypothetical protein
MFPAAPFLSTLLHRVKAVVRRVVRARVDRGRAVPAGAAALAVSPALRLAAGEWMRARLRALSAVMRRIEAGKNVPEPARASRITIRGDASGVRDVVPPERRLPRGFGWMCGLEPDVREDGAAFAAWLGEPAMRAMISAAPERMAQAISPILNATGAARPEWFPVVARRAIAVPCAGTPASCVDGTVSCEVAYPASVVCNDPVAVCDVTGVQGEAAMAGSSPAMTDCLFSVRCDFLVTRAHVGLATTQRFALPWTRHGRSSPAPFPLSQNKDELSRRDTLVHIVTIQ